ncbi:hypothetical protein AXG93_1881s1430 [Marchantia polymorpha subsp. ruderalis]|uniref:Uncharacterized protein n=1 Tax=Marchantia polymorpha subsp. ruderalis TaxID=1480154 RepID=A0A176W5H0_MARPO|nr:hypothetical protein AXG93_1881s1430 [Marchantia polymorpha subsp. ruderalis]
MEKMMMMVVRVANRSPMALVNRVEQCRLRVDLVVSTPLVSSLPIGTVMAMARCDRRDIRHPWSSWDVTRRLLTVAAHAVGEVFHAEVTTKESTETPSLNDVT